MPACGFETEDEIAQWTIIADTAELTLAPVHSGVGAARAFSSTSGEIRFGMDCFQVSGSGSVGYGIYVFPVSGPVWCKLTGTHWENPDCTGFFSIDNGTALQYPAGEWSLIRMAPTSYSPGAKFGLYCFSSSPIEIVVDDAFWGEGMVPAELQSFVIE